VSIRPVKMGERIGAMWEVTEGLKPGDKVVLQGLQKAREGSTVTAKDWTPPAEALVSKADQQKKPSQMSEFFVRRPIVAIVIAILMTLIGRRCILALLIAEYPQIAPPG